MADDDGILTVGTLRSFLTELGVSDDAALLIEGYDEREDRTMWLAVSKASVEVDSDGDQVVRLIYSTV